MLVIGTDNFINKQNKLLKEFVLEDLNTKYQETPDVFFRNENNNLPKVTLMSPPECHEAIRQMWEENGKNAVKLSLAIVVYLIGFAVLAIFSSLAVALLVFGIALIIGVSVSAYQLRVLARARVPLLSEQIMLRIQRIWNEGMTAENWPPIPFFQEPEHLIEQQASHWQNYKDTHSEKEAQDLLFDIVKGVPTPSLTRYNLSLLD